MNSLLSIKEDSLRRLKEDLRRSQRRGEESCKTQDLVVVCRDFLTSNFWTVVVSSVLEGEVLHAKLVNPKGQVVQSSILLEKTKLEEEVKQLHLKITQLER